ncbi:hypothetical protein ACDA63_08055 [Uliginosibacterium sp. sgz301328]|uniref:hypothetical protein n=1 Tax=Uliginosibacterium sp. sgz301328 TaxID=3243764 RepID=UPI00359E1451
MKLATARRLLLCVLTVMAWPGAVLARPDNGGAPPQDDSRRAQGEEGRRDRYKALREDMMRQSAPQRGPKQQDRESSESGLRRLSPEERQQLRRDVRDAGRDVYGR